MSEKKKIYIKCSWQEMGRILINPDGQVYPCCYLCNKAFKTEILGVFGPNNQVEDLSQKGENWYWKTNPESEAGSGDTVMIEYKKHYDELNLKKKSMKDILNHKWFTEILPKSWEKEETRSDQCRQFCEHYVDE